MMTALVVYYSVVAAGVLSIGGGILFLAVDDLILIHKSNGGK